MHLMLINSMNYLTVASIVRFSDCIHHTKSESLNRINPFILFHNKLHPAAMAEMKVRHFLTHLALNEKVSVLRCRSKE